jgi:DNA-binding LacI/PurR family transcriptional regulator
MAIGAVSAIHEAGLSVPHDVSVVGFDDIESASLLRPPLTTIRQNKTALGQIAGESLIRLIEDDDAKPPRIAVAVELIERSSANPLSR